ncbi:MAG: AAA family ATPase [Elusimicrobiota bacterium]|jgi:predicted AAA+ superfamily ATPase|nr:AAA family ATPase [Elusimicrobiota bacterium]
MKRLIINQLLQWKQSKDRKPLILTGARQVGKTWTMQEFGRQHFQNTAYIMFEKNKNMEKLFEGSLSPKDLLPFLQAQAGEEINPETTLIIFDEIQAVPNALTALKFFCEQAPEYIIIAAGSTLGVTLHGGQSFPVGKVDFLTLYPMNFTEFLYAVKEEQLANLLISAEPEKLNSFHERFDKYLRQYFYVGGMPEVLAKYANTHSYDDVRSIQNRLVKSYNNDFSKYANHLTSEKLRLLWHSIPNQIAKESKKFIYGAVKEGARARDFETAIQWLADSSLVNKVNCVAVPKQPLKAYENFGAFKLFIHDIGILGAMVGVSARAIIDEENIYTEFKGALAEQFVCQELTANNIPLFYWYSDDSKREIDFLIETPTGIVPIEVKSGKNLRAVSFTNFIKEYNITKGYKISALQYVDNGNIINLPLYLTCNIKK